MAAAVVRRAVVVVAAAGGFTGCDDIFNIEKIGDARTHDDAALDAFTIESCPAEYNLSFTAGSRYRLLLAPYSVWLQSDDCIDDLFGRTHLAVVDTPAEMVALHAAVDARTPMLWFVGAVQAPTATELGQGWLWFNDNALAATDWNPNGVEPNDGDFTEDRWEQFGALQKGELGLVDYRGALATEALCECDGLAIGPQAKMAVDLNRE
jgi:hypothetical protein